MINTEKVSIAGIKRLFALIPCWKVKQCSEELKQHCAAFNQHDEPCWMVMPKSVRCSNADCRLCEVYRNLSDCRILKRLIADFTNIPEDQSPKTEVATPEPIIHMPEIEIGAEA